MCGKHSGCCCRDRQKELVNGEWEVLGELGSGGFGKVYEVKNLTTGKRAAVKFEKVKRGGAPTLDQEYAVYRKANNLVSGLPNCYFFGYNSQRTHKALVISLLGTDLKEILRGRDRELSHKTVLMIGLQALARLRSIHELGFIHCDIKPRNMMIGKRDPERIYIADFGLSSKYRHEGVHVPFQQYRSLVGSLMYTSLNAHSQCTLSRRDDLESLGYSLIELFKGKLPWRNARDVKDVHRRKLEVSIHELCKSTPSAMKDYMTYVRKMDFAEKPDYDYLMSLLSDALRRRGLTDDRDFDWMQNESS